MFVHFWSWQCLRHRRFGWIRNGLMNNCSDSLIFSYFSWSCYHLCAFNLAFLLFLHVINLFRSVLPRLMKMHFIRLFLSLLFSMRYPWTRQLRSCSSIAPIFISNQLMMPQIYYELITKLHSSFSKQSNFYLYNGIQLKEKLCSKRF